MHNRSRNGNREMSDDVSTEWEVKHFSQSNPAGPGQGNVAALLRRVADTLDTLGSIEVADVTFQSIPTADEDDLTMTVYYTPKS